MATGKEPSNSFMASSLPKTIHFCDSLQSDEDKFKNHLSDNEESLGEDASKQGRIDDADAEMSEPIIEEWESDSEDDEIVVKPKEVTKTVKPSFEKIESVNARNETLLGERKWIANVFSRVIKDHLKWEHKGYTRNYHEEVSSWTRRPRTYESQWNSEKKRYDGRQKDIWDNVKSSYCRSELKQKKNSESQLYRVFERLQDVQALKGIGRPSQNQRYFARRNGTAGNGGAQNRAGNANAGQGKPVKCYNCNGVGHILRNCTQPNRPQNSDYFKDKMLLMQAQENGAVLDEEELLFLASEQGNTFDADVDNQPVQDLALNKDNIFQADESDAFDSDVDDEPTAQTIFMANLSSAGSENPQAGLSNASILSEVHTLENAIDHSVTNQDEHEIHNEVQQSNVIDSTSVYMGNSNVIPYEQYLSVNNISVVPSCASSTLNNVCVSSDNDAFVPHDPIANELKIYKEQVAIYEQRAKFELTEREQRMDDQMRMLIQNRNKMEENLKKELHSVKLQLNSTMENNKIIEGTVTTLKQELKQKESKFLTDFSNLKHLNDKLENKLHSQDQSI
ncbi:retrovirus-related pol polyprotein from transposon TNT 1-94 [Tanacetum coccineum]|uniref:Retrovirus-related pol polyprotein from transposon TNT 1-94 n=1 Tax=Tanacetum coccineum TaxID=301880 RepID=A0ABQ4WXF1_9ASTR